MRSYKNTLIPKGAGQIHAEARAGAFRSPRADAKSAALAALRTLSEWSTLQQVVGFMNGYGLEAAADEQGARTALDALCSQGLAVKNQNSDEWRATK